MKRILTLLLLLTSSLLYSQATLTDLNLVFDILASNNVTSSTFEVEGAVFHSTTEYSGLGVQVGDLVYFQDGPTTYSLPIQSITTQNYSYIKVVLVDESSTVSYVPTGRAAVVSVSDPNLLPVPPDGIPQDLATGILNDLRLKIQIGVNNAEEITDYIGSVDTPPAYTASLHTGETWRNSVGQLFYSNGSTWLTDKEVLLTNTSLLNQPSSIYKLGIDTSGVNDVIYVSNNNIFKKLEVGGTLTGEVITVADTTQLDTVHRVQFYQYPLQSGGERILRWNDTDGTLDLGLKGGNVTLQLGQEQVSLVKHADNSGLDNGKVVYLVGSDGQNKTVRYARANSEATSAVTFGLMTESSTGGNKAFTTTFGLVRNINTSNLTEGKVVWLSADTAGAMTAVRPTAPNHGVMIGFCVRKHATQGVIFVEIQNGYELNELHDVFVPSPTNGQVLTWNSTNARWEAITPANQLQTLSTNGSAGNISISSGNTITLNVNDADASATNELQTLSVSANTATLSNSGGSVTIAGAGINTVGTAGTTITVTGTEVDGSTTNELQTLSTGTNTLTLSNGGGTVTVDTDPTDDVTGSGTTNRTALWTGTKTLGANAFYGLVTQTANGITQGIGSYSFYGQVDNIIAPYIGQGAYAKDATGAISPAETTFRSSLLTLTESNEIGLSYYTAPVGTATTTNIFTNSFLRFRVSRAGNTGIGGVVTPAARLHVSGSSALSADRAVLVTDNATTPLNLFEIRNNGDIYFNDYPNTLNTTGNPVNVLSTGTDGLLQSHPISEVISSAGGVTGSGVAGQVTFWNGTSTVTGDNGLFWDNTNKRLGVGTISPETGLDVLSNNGTMRLQRNSNDNQQPFFGFRKSRGTLSAQLPVVERDLLGAFGFIGFGPSSYLVDRAFIGAQVTGSVTSTDLPTSIYFKASSTASPYNASFYIHHSGRLRAGNNLFVGATLPQPNAKLEVVGEGETSGTTAFLVRNGAATPANLLSVLDNGNVGVGTAAPAVALDVFGQVKIGGNFTLTDNNAFSVFGNQTARQITNNSGTSITNSVGFFSGTIDLMGSQAFTNSNGIIFAINNKNTNSANNIAAGNFTLTNDATNAGLTNGYAIVGRVLNNSNLAITNVRNFHSDVLNPAATNVITNLYLYNAEVATNNGTITSTYGFHVGDITKGTQTNTPFSFYASDPNALNYFAGNTGIGVTAPTRTLDINGETRIRDLTTTTATGLVGADADGVLSNVTFASAVSQGGGLTGNGVTNYLAQYNSSNTLDTTGIIWTGGRMGIGTATPSSTFDVVGSVEYQNPTTAFDGPTLGAELLTTATGTNWTGTGFATGYTHTVGSTAALVAATSPANATYYQIVITTTGRTAGSFTFSFGGYTNATISADGTTTIGPLTTSTSPLTITPTTDFNGTVSATIKSISASSAIYKILNSSGAVVFEQRAQRIENYFQGYFSGRVNTTGLANTFIGSTAGQSNTTASNNTFIGYNAGGNNTIGESNVFIGPGAGRDNVSGSSNFFMGRNTGLTNTVGTGNLAIGTLSGVFMVRGNANVYLGTNAGYNNASGSNNVLIGSLAGRFYSESSLADTSINNSIFIGANTRSTLIGQTNQIIIANSGRGLGSNTTRIGNTSTIQTHLDGRLTIGNTFYDSRVAARIVGADASSSNYSLVVTDSDGATSTTVDPNFVVRNDGNVGIGTYSPATRLNVHGTGTIIQATNSSSSKISFRILDNGGIRMGSGGSSPYFFPAADLGSSSNIDGTNLTFYNYTTSQPAPLGKYLFTGEQSTQTTGDNFCFYINERFVPTSGNATSTAFYVRSEINQTAGGTGITRGLSVVPFLQSAVQYQSIHWNTARGTNNWGLYGEGTAINYLQSNLGIGSTSPARLLHVQGEARISDLTTDTPTRIVGADADGDLGEITLGSGLSITSGTISVTNPISASEVFIESSTATTIDLDANTGVVKDVNGTNASFTLPTDLSRLNVYKNGIRLARTGTATTRDFSVNTGTNEITFTTALLSTDRIVIVKI